MIQDQILTADDTVFIHQQIATSSAYRLQAEMLPGYKLIPKDTLESIAERLTTKGKKSKLVDELEQRYGTSMFGQIAMPLFSRDFQTVIVEINQVCFGLCGRGEIFVVRRHKGKWQVVKTISGFIA
ncbi:hypothetical protein GCM10023186_10710 [Hymenobacter koreensis]|uniref:SAP domain-containing protein n=1 Tax=Hymenobacter koreensis TaxID=1084523 RepID=A0ABP8IW97_9BACT